MIQLKIFIDPSVLPGEQLTACLSLVVDDASVIVEVATFQLLGFMASNSVKSTSLGVLSIQSATLLMILCAVSRVGGNYSMRNSLYPKKIPF